MSVTDEIAQDAGRAEGSPERPGARLKKAREARGFDVAKVSAELRLSQRIVAAIEADLYRELPEPAFVRGYMRRYAQLVQLSPDDIAARFD
ncbi:MAG: helix-turn-helix domain-containing protein, partial [Sulfurimicrobium sp.]